MDDAENPAVHRTAPSKEVLAQNVSRAKTEKPMCVHKCKWVYLLLLGTCDLIL